MNSSSVPDDSPGPRPLDSEDLTGTLVVGADEVSVISAVHEGPVEVYGSLAIEGLLKGSLTVESLGRVLVSGDVEGSVDVRVAASVFILPSGRIAGTIVNHGSVINQGWRSGRVEGRPPEDQEGALVAAPLSGVDRYPTLPAR